MTRAKEKMVFNPPLSEGSRKLCSLSLSFIAFAVLVTFFLYENRKKRNVFIEILLAVFSAITLGSAIFFNLIGVDTIL